jgi:hypothetical protein
MHFLTQTCRGLAHKYIWSSVGGYDTTYEINYHAFVFTSFNRTFRITGEHSFLVITRSRVQFPIRWSAILTRFSWSFSPSGQLPGHAMIESFHVISKLIFIKHPAVSSYPTYLCEKKKHSPANRIHSFTNYQRLKGVSLLLMLREPTEKPQWPGLGTAYGRLAYCIWLPKFEFWNWKSTCFRVL